MKRWNNRANAFIDTPGIDAFIEDVLAVCKQHGFSISHEDGHGAFMIEDADNANFDWLRAAHDNTDE